MLKNKIKSCLHLIKKESNLNLKFFFKFYVPENRSNWKKITFPYGHRIKSKKIFFITKKKLRKKEFNFGKTIDQFNFEKKLRNSFFENSNFRKSFLIFQNKLKTKNKKLLDYFFLKNQSFLTYCNFSKDLHYSLFKSLSFFWKKTPKDFLYNCKLPGRNCIGKLINNITQIFGNIIDFLPKGISSIRKISITSEKMPNFQISFFD